MLISLSYVHIYTGHFDHELHMQCKLLSWNNNWKRVRTS